MWLSYLDVQFNHGSKVFLADWKYLDLCYFDTLSVSQQMSRSSLPCNCCPVRGEANTETQGGASSQGYRPSVIDLCTVGVQSLQ